MAPKDVSFTIKAKDAASAELKRIENGLSQLKGKLFDFGNIWKMALGSLAGFSLSVIIKDILDLGTAVDKAMRQIAASLPTGVAGLRELSKTIDAVAEASGRSTEDIRAAAVEIARLGVSGPQEVQARLRAAVTFADATGADLRETVQGLDQVMDTFSLSAAQAEQALAGIVSAASGRTDVESLFAGFQRAAPVVAKLGVDAETTTRALVALLDRGMNAKQAGAFLASLDASGIRQLAKEATIGGDALQRMHEKAAFVQGSAERATGVLKNRLSAVLADIGTKLLPLANAGLQILNNALDLLVGRNWGQIMGNIGRFGPGGFAMPTTPTGKGGITSFSVTSDSYAAAGGARAPLPQTIAEQEKLYKLTLEYARAKQKEKEATDALNAAVEQELRLKKQLAALLAGNLPLFGSTQWGGRAMPNITAGTAPGVSDALEKELAARIAAGKKFTDAELEEVRKRNAAQLKGLTDEQKEEEQIRKNFLRQFQETFSAGVANMLAHGLGSWRSFFDSLKSLFTSAIGDMVAKAAASKLGSIFTREEALAGGSGGWGITASASALGVAGVIVGAFAAVGTAIVAAGNAASEALMEQHRLLESAIARAKAYASTNSVQDQIDEETRKFRMAMKDLGADPPRTAVNREAERQAAIAATREAYERHVQAIRDAAKAADEAAAAEKRLTEQRAQMRRVDDMNDLEVRRLRSQGMDREADEWALQEKNRREYDQAVAAGWSDAELAWLRTIQQMEYAAWLAAQIAVKDPLTFDLGNQGKGMSDKSRTLVGPVDLPGLVSASGLGGTSASVAAFTALTTVQGDYMVDHLLSIRRASESSAVSLVRLVDVWGDRGRGIDRGSPGSVGAGANVGSVHIGQIGPVHVGAGADRGAATQLLDELIREIDIRFGQRSLLSALFRGVVGRS